jgi:hypothetical protein
METLVPAAICHHTRIRVATGLTESRFYSRDTCCGAGRRTAIARSAAGTGRRRG